MTGISPDTALFTFHNVSINSNRCQSMQISTNSFTFHNVSINSKAEYQNVGYVKSIYIP